MRWILLMYLILPAATMALGLALTEMSTRILLLYMPVQKHRLTSHHEHFFCELWPVENLILKHMTST
jgi:hypothetical protein